MIKNSKYEKINSANPLYLIITKVNGHFEEININKYLMLVPTNGSKEIIEKSDVWQRRGTTQNFLLVFIDELEKQLFFKKTVEADQ